MCVCVCVCVCGCVCVRERKKERMTEWTSKKCGAARATRSLLRKKAGLNKRKKNWRNGWVTSVEYREICIINTPPLPPKDFGTNWASSKWKRELKEKCNPSFNNNVIIINTRGNRALTSAMLENCNHVNFEALIPEWKEFDVTIYKIMSEKK